MGLRCQRPVDFIATFFSTERKRLRPGHRTSLRPDAGVRQAGAGPTGGRVRREWWRASKALGELEVRQASQRPNAGGAFDAGALAVLGRVVDVLGRPVDGGPPFAADLPRLPIHREVPAFQEQGAGASRF
jgi:hypothetical protein